MVAHGPDYDCHSTGEQDFTLVQCRDGACRTYYLNPRPTVAALPQIYSADEYYSYSFSEQGNPVVLRARLTRDQQKVRLMLAALGRPAATVRVLDIGAGDGSLLEAFRLAGTPGSHLHAAELDRRAVEQLEARGFQAHLKRAEDLDFPAGSFDAVTMIQVIEHVAEPRHLLEKIRGMLAPGGVVFMETPNMDAWDRGFFRESTWGGYHFPRHWTLWDPASMKHTLEAAGFQLISLSTPPAAVLWVWSINHVLQAWFGDGRIARFFSMNNPLVLAPFWLLEILPSRLGRSANMRVLARRQ